MLLTAAASLVPSPISAPVSVAGENRTSFRHYAAFGGILRSELELPELPAAAPCAEPDWTIRVEGTSPSYSLVFLGERQRHSEHYRLSRHPCGFRLEYSHAGTFDISADGTSITWYHEQAALPELVRNIVLGPAMALALEAAGLLCLHGSAVAIGDRAIAFLGPKHFGKSTLAAALTANGARLLGDDLLAISIGTEIVVRPGVASVRLWPDMTTTLPLTRVSHTLIPGIKTTVTGVSPNAVALGPAVLCAVYLLSPTAKGLQTRGAWRTRLDRLDATVALAHHAKLPDKLVGVSVAGSRLASAAALAAKVPIWTLHIVRDVARLDATVQQILDWSRGE